ncbi:hypothetical protein ACFL2K_03165 [Candidatus Margulisiibacteriota bacterium]
MKKILASRNPDIKTIQDMKNVTDGLESPFSCDKLKAERKLKTIRKKKNSADYLKRKIIEASKEPVSILYKTFKKIWRPIWVWNSERVTIRNLRTAVATYGMKSFQLLITTYKSTNSDKVKKWIRKTIFESRHKNEFFSKDADTAVPGQMCGSEEKVLRTVFDCIDRKDYDSALKAACAVKKTVKKPTYSYRNNRATTQNNLARISVDDPTKTENYYEPMWKILFEEIPKALIDTSYVDTTANKSVIEEHKDIVKAVINYIPTGPELKENYKKVQILYMNYAKQAVSELETVSPSAYIEWRKNFAHLDKWSGPFQRMRDAFIGNDPSISKEETGFYKLMKAFKEDTYGVVDQSDEEVQRQKLYDHLNNLFMNGDFEHCYYRFKGDETPNLAEMNKYPYKMVKIAAQDKFNLAGKLVEAYNSSDIKREDWAHLPDNEIDAKIHELKLEAVEKAFKREVDKAGFLKKILEANLTGMNLLTDQMNWDFKQENRRALVEALIEKGDKESLKVVAKKQGICKENTKKLIAAIKAKNYTDLMYTLIIKDNLAVDTKKQLAEYFISVAQKKDVQNLVNILKRVNDLDTNSHRTALAKTLTISKESRDEAIKNIIAWGGEQQIASLLKSGRDFGGAVFDSALNAKTFYHAAYHYIRKFTTIDLNNINEIKRFINKTKVIVKRTGLLVDPKDKNIRNDVFEKLHKKEFFPFIMEKTEKSLGLVLDEFIDKVIEQNNKNDDEKISISITDEALKEKLDKGEYELTLAEKVALIKNVYDKPSNMNKIKKLGQTVVDLYDYVKELEKIVNKAAKAYSQITDGRVTNNSAYCKKLAGILTDELYDSNTKNPVAIKAISMDLSPELYYIQTLAAVLQSKGLALETYEKAVEKIVSFGSKGIDKLLPVLKEASFDTRALLAIGEVMLTKAKGLGMDDYLVIYNALNIGEETGEGDKLDVYAREAKAKATEKAGEDTAELMKMILNPVQELQQIKLGELVDMAIPRVSEKDLKKLITDPTIASKADQIGKDSFAAAIKKYIEKQYRNQQDGYVYEGSILERLWKETQNNVYVKRALADKIFADQMEPKLEHTNYIFDIMAETSLEREHYIKATEYLCNNTANLGNCFKAIVSKRVSNGAVNSQYLEDIAEVIVKHETSSPKVTPEGSFEILRSWMKYKYTEANQALPSGVSLSDVQPVDFSTSLITQAFNKVQQFCLRNPGVDYQKMSTFVNQLRGDKVVGRYIQESLGYGNYGSGGGISPFGMPGMGMTGMGVSPAFYPSTSNNMNDTYYRQARLAVDNPSLYMKKYKKTRQQLIQLMEWAYPRYTDLQESIRRWQQTSYPELNLMAM